MPIVEQLHLRRTINERDAHQHRLLGPLFLTRARGLPGGYPSLRATEDAAALWVLAILTLLGIALAYEAYTDALRARGAPGRRYRLDKEMTRQEAW